jgi:hypothetical protein
MSILNSPNNELPPAPKRVAKRLVGQAFQTYQYLLSTFEEGVKNFWKNPAAKPEEIALELGTDAAELFHLHARLGDFLSQFNPEKVNQIRSLVGQFNINSDGTVTIVNQEQNN